VVPVGVMTREIREDLRVGGVHVVRLAERLLGDLPVGLDDLGDVGFDVAVLEVPDLELLDRFPEVLRERSGVGVGVDEDEPRPRVDAARGQVEVVRTLVDVGEVPRSRNVGEGAVEGPREAVEVAADLRAVALVVLQLATAVEAGVRVRLDLARVGANDEVRPAGDLVDDVVTRLGNVVFAAGELPHPGPETLLLLLVPLTARVALDRHVLAAEVAG